MIYEDERIKVTERQGKIWLQDKFSGQYMSMNPATFYEMCREVSQTEAAKADIWKKQQDT